VEEKKRRKLILRTGRCSCAKVAQGFDAARATLTEACAAGRKLLSRIENSFIAKLKLPFKFSPHHRQWSDWEPTVTMA
jgi:hypothetical protein